jgi:hypothetical protein
MVPSSRVKSAVGNRLTTDMGQGFNLLILHRIEQPTGLIQASIGKETEFAGPTGIPCRNWSPPGHGVVTGWGKPEVPRKQP